jgi:Tol biopolymer transport system component
MNGDTRIERQLPQILADLGAAPSPDYADILLARTAATRQRPGWVFPERWLPMSVLTERIAAAPRVPLRAVAVIALLIIAVAAVALIAGSRQRHVPAPFGPAANGVIPYVLNGDLYAGDPVTGTSRLLLGGPGDVRSPQFSPDGTRIVFARDVGTAEEKPADVYVANEDGSHQVRVTPAPVWNALSLAWTPDGSGIAVVSNVDAGHNRLDVYAADGLGSARSVLSALDLELVGFQPPDGRRILYKAKIGDTRGLWAMDLDGSNSRLLLASDPASDDFWGGASWSADGSRIFYTRPYERPSADGSTCCSLWVANGDGSSPRLFVPNDGTAWDGGPVVSPDGRLVAYWHASQVSVAPADGQGPVVRLGSVLPKTAHFTWAPDSSKLLMWSDDDSSTHAYLLDPSGGPSTTVPWESDPDLDWQRLALR